MKDSFLEHDAASILNIPLNLVSSLDEVICHLDSKGIFSVKSAYRLGIQLQEASEASVSNIQQKEGYWKNFWKAKIPTKILICGRRLYNDILPTRVNLINRGMDINPTCVLCRKKPESATPSGNAATLDRYGTPIFHTLMLVFWMTGEDGILRIFVTTSGEKIEKEAGRPKTSHEA